LPPSALSLQPPPLALLPTPHLKQKAAAASQASNHISNPTAPSNIPRSASATRGACDSDIGRWQTSTACLIPHHMHPLRTPPAPTPPRPPRATSSHSQPTSPLNLKAGLCLAPRAARPALATAAAAACSSTRVTRPFETTSSTLFGAVSRATRSSCCPRVWERHSLQVPYSTPRSKPKPLIVF
jgi:hypothetical protein